MVERFHGQLKTSLRARLASSDWFNHLPWVLLSLRGAPKDSSTVSAADFPFLFQFYKTFKLKLILKILVKLCKLLLLIIEPLETISLVAFKAFPILADPLIFD